MKSMIDILKEMLPYGLEIEHYTEYNVRYSVSLLYNSDCIIYPSYGRARTTTELPKLVFPGTEREMCGYAVCNAMSTMMMKMNKPIEAKEWLDKIISGEYKTLGQKPKSISVCKLVPIHGDAPCYGFKCLYECVETYEEANLLAQYAMKYKQDNELIAILPGSNRPLSEEETLRAKDLADGYMVKKE